MIKTGVQEYQWDPYVADVFRILKPGTGYAQFIETSLATWENDDVPQGSPFGLVTSRLTAQLRPVLPICRRTLS